MSTIIYADKLNWKIFRIVDENSLVPFKKNDTFLCCVFQTGASYAVCWSKSGLNHLFHNFFMFSFLFPSCEEKNRKKRKKLSKNTN